MRISLLVESRMQPIPENIEVVQVYGEEACVGVETDRILARGDCMVIDGDPQDIADWLRPFDCVWTGNGQIGFTANHVK